MLRAVLVDKFAETFLKVALGQNISNFYLEEFPRKNIVSPLILAYCSHILVRYNMSWLVFTETIEIE